MTTTPSRLRFGLAGAVLLTGCYASHSSGFPSDAGDPDAGADSGFLDAGVVEPDCECPCMDAERACPAGLGTRVPVLESREGITVHWPRELGCIAIEYEPVLEPHRADIEWALSAWFDLPCSSLCFRDPVGVEANNRFCAHAFHFVQEGFFTESWGTCGSPGTSGLLYTSVTGALQHACPVVSESPTRRELLAAVGHALGLAQPSLDDEGVESVLSGRAEDRDRTELGRDDIAAFCAFYGERPYCPY